MSFLRTMSAERRACVGKKGAMAFLSLWKAGLEALLQCAWLHEQVQRHEARHGFLPQEHTLGSSLLGLGLGLGLIVYALSSIMRGYVPHGHRDRDRKQEPLAFWLHVLFILLFGSFIVVVCVVALWKGEAFER